MQTTRRRLFNRTAPVSSDSEDIGAVEVIYLLSLDNMMSRHGEGTVQIERNDEVVFINHDYKLTDQTIF